MTDTLTTAQSPIISVAKDILDRKKSIALAYLLENMFGLAYTMETLKNVTVKYDAERQCEAYYFKGKYEDVWLMTVSVNTPKDTSIEIEIKTWNMQTSAVNKSIADAPDWFVPGHTYNATHKHTGERWYLLGVDIYFGNVCAAGWPASMAKISDFTDVSFHAELTQEEFEHRKNKFGRGWL